VDTYCRKRFDSRTESCCSSCLGGYESQDENRRRFENKEEEKKVKRIFPVAKRGIILPILLLLGILGSLAGAATGVAKVVNDNKAAQRQLEELKRHNRAIKGHGLYLAPYKSGQGVSIKKKNVQETLKMSKGVTTNVQLQQLANRMRIPYFRVIFMRTTILRGICRNESGIMNLDNAEGPDTHWVAYAKRGNRAIYFDSFDNLRPPKELVRNLYLEK